MAETSLNENKKQSGKRKSLLEVLAVSLKLGLTSFGGPVAHLGYFHEEYVRRRKWLDERSYADLVALSQFLPGPASSQAGIGIGILRAGLWGGLAAWIGFTLPSVFLMALFALLLQGYDVGGAGWIHGLKIVAVAIVGHAVLGMGQKLAPDRSRATIAVIAAIVALMWQSALSQVAVIVIAGGIGALWLRTGKLEPTPAMEVPIRRTTAVISLTLFFVLLLFLPILREITASDSAALFDSFYRAGSLVFGGGHVVLPLLEREIVPAGWVTGETFLTGYGAAQAIPGPLFTFAAYLGAAANGWFGAFTATIAIFLPAFLLMIGTLPFWSMLRSNKLMQGSLKGMNAAVVGILLAALYDPVWTSAVITPGDFALAAVLFGMLVFWKLPPWVVVLTGAAGGLIFSYF
jgi:chromate transporter